MQTILNSKVSDILPLLQVIEYQNKLNINKKVDREKAIQILINSIKYN